MIKSTSCAALPKRSASSRWGPPQASSSAQVSAAPSTSGPVSAQLPLLGARQSFAFDNSRALPSAAPAKAASPDRDPWKLSKALRGQMSAAGAQNPPDAQVPLLH